MTLVPSAGPATAQFPRITVALTFLMENWSEGTAPPYSPMTSPPKAGEIDRAGIEWSTYGGLSGMARLIRIATRHGVRGTVCVNARSAELFPDTLRHAVASGFDVGAHNYAQDEVLSGLSEPQERAVFERSLRILRDVTGVQPTGWLSATLASTERTAELVAEHGLLWHGDYNYLDQPERLQTARGAIVAIPHSDYADNRVLRGAPRDWFDCYRDTFDYLYANEPGALINVTMHGNFGGRPLMAAQLDKLLAYIVAHDDVWMPRHDELALWVDRHRIARTDYVARFAA